MNFKKLIVVSLFLLIIFSISAANAASDDNTTQISDDEILEIDDTAELEIPEESNEIVKENENKTYVDFEIEVDEEIMQNYEGEYIHVKNFPEDYTGGIFEASVDGDYYIVSLTQRGGIEVDFTGLSVGLHNITIVTTETDKYLMTTKTFSFNVSAVKSIIPTKVIYGSDDGIRIYAPFAKSGTVVVNVDGEEFKRVDLSKEVANYITNYTIPLGGLSYPAVHLVEVISTVGDYRTVKRVNVTALGYEVYISIVGTGTYGSGPNNNWITYGGAKNRIEVIVPGDAKGKPKVTVDGIPVDNVKDTDYCYSAYIPSLGIGMHNVTASYEDSKYHYNEVSDTFEVRPYIKFPTTTTYGSGDAVSLSLPENANGTLKLYISDKTYVRSENESLLYKSVKMENGKASIPISYLSEGRHYIYVTYDGDDYNVTARIDMIRVNKKISFEAKDLSMYYGDGTKYSVKVLRNDKAVGAGETVTITVGTTKYTVKTNKNGVATVALTKLPGKYTILVKYLGGKLKTKLTVKKVLALKTVKVKKSAKKLVLSATLKKGTKPIKNTKVTFKFNGKTYSAKTNSKGVAKYTIKKSVLKKLKVGKKVAYQVTYKKCTVKKTATVKK